METIKKIVRAHFSFFLSLPAILWPMMLMIIPLIILFYASFLNNAHHISSENYIHFFDTLYIKVLFQSLFFALSTTIGTILIGYPVACFIAFYSKKYKYALLFLLTLPFWSNFIIQVYAWFFLLDKEGVCNTLLMHLHIIHTPLTLMYTAYAIIFIMIYCYLPFMVIPIYNSLEKVDQKILEASMDLGATQWYTLRHIILPLSVTGLKTGIILVLVPSFGEFVIPSLIGGGKYLSVGSLISYYYIEIYNQKLGASFTLLSGIFLLSCIMCLFYLIDFFLKKPYIKGQS